MSELWIHNRDNTQDSSPKIPKNYIRDPSFREDICTIATELALRKLVGRRLRRSTQD